MSNALPPGWVLTTLGECFKWSSGGTPLTNNPEFYGGPIPWLVIGDLNDSVVFDSVTHITEKGLSASSAKWVKPGSVLVAMYGSIGKAAIAGIRLTTNQAIAFTMPDPVDPWYLFYYIKLSQARLADLGKGATQRNISQTVIKSFPFPLAPPEEQHRIVTRIKHLLSLLDAGVVNLERAKTSVRRYRSSVLKAAVEGRLTEQWRADHPDVEPASVLLRRVLVERRREREDILAQHANKKRASVAGLDAEYVPTARTDIAGLPGLPEGWSWASVDQLIDIVDYRGRTPPFSDSGIPHLRSSNVKNGRVIWDGVTFVSERTYAEYMTRGLPQEGDLLFTTEAPLGEVAIVPAGLRFSLAQRLVLLRADRETLWPEFLMYQVMSDPFRSQCMLRSSGSTVTGISSRNLKRVMLRIPPLKEQQAIAAITREKLLRVEELEPVVAGSIARALRLKQAILKAAFGGALH